MLITFGWGQVLLPVPGAHQKQLNRCSVIFMGHTRKDEVLSLCLFFPVGFSELIPQKKKKKKNIENFGTNLIVSLVSVHL